MDFSPPVTEALAARGLPTNLGVFVCGAVASGERPVRHVTHDEDGDWQFLCGGDHQGDPTDGADVAQLWAIAAMVERDPTLTEVLGLGEGEHAWRAEVGSGWRFSRS